MTSPPDDLLQRDAPGRPSTADRVRWVSRLGSRSPGRGPLAIAGFLAIPLFFSSLMASTLALEKPNKIQWHGCASGTCTVWHDPTGWNTAKVWGWALVPPLILVLVGWLACRLPLGFYVSCLAGIVIALGVIHDTGKWALHHTARFPLGVDNIPHNNSFSNLYDRGEWEQMARETAVSLGRWTIGIAIAAIAVTVFLAIRSQRKSRRPPVVGVPIEGVHGPDMTLPGVQDNP